MPAAGLCRSVFTSPLWDSRYWMPDLEKTVDKNRLLSPLLSTGKDHLKARRGQVSCVEGVSFSFVEGVNYPRAPVTLRRGCRKNHVTAPGKAWSAHGQAAARAARDRRPLRKRPRELCQATAGQLVFCQPCLIRRALDLGTAWGETGRSQCSQKSLLQPGTVACGSLT